MLLRKERKTSTLSFQSNQLWLKIQALLYFLLHLVRQFMTVSNNKKSYRDENFHRNERFISLFLFIYIKKFDKFHDFIFHLKENNGVRITLILKQFSCYTGVQYFTLRQQRSLSEFPCNSLFKTLYASYSCLFLILRYTFLQINENTRLKTSQLHDQE